MTLSESIYLRYYKWSGLILLLFASFQFIFGISPGWTEIRSDFPNYYVSGALLFESPDSLQLYNNDWFQEKIHEHKIAAAGKFSPFPPPTAFLIAPLTVFEPIVAKRIWLILNLAFIVLISILIKKISRFKLRDGFILLLCSGLACANTLMLGQMYLLLLLSMLYSYHLLISNKQSTAGLVIGAGIAVKYFPLVFFPSLFYKRKWKCLTSIMITIAFLNFAAVLLLGINTYVDFFESILFQHLNGKLEGQSPWSNAFQSWNALAYNLFKYDAIENPNPFMQSESLFCLFKYGVQLSILAIMILVLTKHKGKADFFEAALILFSVTVLYLTPAGATYHSLLLLFPFTLMAKIAPLNNPTFKKIWLILITCLVLSGLIPLLQNKIPFLNSNMLFSFYRLWLMSIIFISVCYWVYYSEKYATSGR